MRVAVLLFAAAVLTAAPPAHAQLELDASGNVGVGVAGPSSNSRMYVVGSNTYGLYVIGGKYGLRGQADPGTGSAMGVRGEASSQYSTAKGIYGHASTFNSTAYGVHGAAFSQSGAAYAGYFSGDLVYTGQMWDASDRKLKKNIRGLEAEGVLERISRLRPSSYEHIGDEQGKRLGLGRGRQFGFIAQEVEEVFPELVSEQTHVLPPEPLEEGAEEDPAADKTEEETITFKAVNYVEMIPLLVQALQEQQARIEALEAALEQRGGSGNGRGN